MSIDGNIIYEDLTDKRGIAIREEYRKLLASKTILDNPSSEPSHSTVRKMTDIQTTQGFIPLNIEGINAGKVKDTAKMKLGNKLIAFGTPGSATQHYADEVNKKNEKNLEYEKAVKEANERPNTTNIPQNLQSGVEQYGTLQYANEDAQKALGPNVTSIEMIENGFRTRTTRTDSELNKYKIKVGSYIKMFGKDQFGNTKNIIVKITKITKGYDDVTWYKEGWTQEGLQKLKNHTNSANAVEFEVIKPKNDNNAVNSGTYSSNDIVNISVVGKERPNQAELVEKTKQEILKAAEQGVNYFVADTKATAKSPHNIDGEGVIADWFTNELPKLGYKVEYGETKDGHAGIYKVVKIGNQQQYSNPSEYTNHSGGANENNLINLINDLSLEFTEKENLGERLSNYIVSSKMSKEKAIETLYVALKVDRDSVIKELKKDCYK